MKKRIFSFVIMVVTLVALIAFSTPNIINNSKTGMEFNGGFDILYEIKTEDETTLNDSLAKTAAEGIEKRLDISNVIDPIVSIEGEKYVRVTVSASSQLVADDIRSVIENNAQISFRDYENNLMATGEEILEDVGASLTEDSYGNAAILLHIKDTDLLASITSEIYALTDKHLVVWLGYEEGDDYANLETDASVAKKIIYNAEVSGELKDSTISITGNFTKSQAQSTIDLINSGTLDYELSIVQISAIEASSANNSLNKTLIAGLIIICLVVVALTVYYKIGGLVSSISLLFNTFLSILLFVTFKGIINQQMIAGLIISLSISIDAIIIVLERVKKELYNGKSVERAVSEGYKKSTSAIVDTNIVVLIMSLIMYFFGNSVANFALMLSLGSVVTLVIMTFLNKFILSLVSKLNISPVSLGAKKAYIENKEIYIESKANKISPLNSKKKFMAGLGIFVGVSVIVMLVLQFTMGSLFNYNNTINKNSNVTIITNVEYFTDEAHVMEFFGDDSLNIELKDIEMSSYEKDGIKKYKTTVTTKNSIISVEDELVNKIIDAVGENKEYDERYELYINDINPKSTVVSLLSALYASGIGLLIIGVYLAIRYRYSYAIAAVISTICSIVLTALFLGLTRIKIGSDAVIAIYAIVVYSIATLIVIFDRLKEMISNTNKKYISNDERYEAITNAINVSLPRTTISMLFVTMISIVFLAFSSIFNYSFYVSLVVGLIVCSICAIMISSQIWLLFEENSEKRKRTFKPKNNKNRKFKELEEHVFIGIND